MIRKRMPLVAALVVLVAHIMPSAAALAAGSSESTPPPAASDPNWTNGVKAVKAGQYEQAITLLEQVIAKNPDNVDAQNYLGYANSRIGQIDVAKRYYARALALMPDHKGANEYLGELHLKLGQLAEAEKRLQVLDKACFFGCDEFYALRDAIAEYKKSGKFESRKRL